MIFDPPDVVLKKFTEQHCKKKSIAMIPLRDLEKWQKLTKETEGQYIAKFMAAKLWADSVGSLQTAAAIVGAYTPKALVTSDAFQKTLTGLHDAIFREVKRQYVAKHGDFDQQLRSTRPRPKQ